MSYEFNPPYAFMLGTTGVRPPEEHVLTDYNTGNLVGSYSEQAKPHKALGMVGADGAVKACLGAERARPGALPVVRYKVGTIIAVLPTGGAEAFHKDDKVVLRRGVYTEVYHTQPRGLVLLLEELDEQRLEGGMDQRVVTAEAWLRLVTKWPHRVTLPEPYWMDTDRPTMLPNVPYEIVLGDGYSSITRYHHQPPLRLQYLVQESFYVAHPQGEPAMPYGDARVPYCTVSAVLSDGSINSPRCQWHSYGVTGATVKEGVVYAPAGSEGTLRVRCTLGGVSRECSVHMVGERPSAYVCLGLPGGTWSDPTYRLRRKTKLYYEALSCSSATAVFDLRNNGGRTESPFTHYGETSAINYRVLVGKVWGHVTVAEECFYDSGRATTKYRHYEAPNLLWGEHGQVVSYTFSPGSLEYILVNSVKLPLSYEEEAHTRDSRLHSWSPDTDPFKRNSTVIASGGNVQKVLYVGSTGSSQCVVQSFTKLTDTNVHGYPQPEMVSVGNYQGTRPPRSWLETGVPPRQYTLLEKEVSMLCVDGSDSRGGAVQLHLVRSSDGGSADMATWSSSDPEAASVDDAGYVTALSGKGATGGAHVLVTASCGGERHATLLRVFDSMPGEAVRYLLAGGMGLSHMHTTFRYVGDLQPMQSALLLCRYNAACPRAERTFYSMPSVPGVASCGLLPKRSDIAVYGHNAVKDYNRVQVLMHRAQAGGELVVRRPVTGDTGSCAAGYTGVPTSYSGVTEWAVVGDRVMVGGTWMGTMEVSDTVGYEYIPNYRYLYGFTGDYGYTSVFRVASDGGRVGVSGPPSSTTYNYTGPGTVELAFGPDVQKIVALGMSAEVVPEVSALRVRGTADLLYIPQNYTRMLDYDGRGETVVIHNVGRLGRGYDMVSRSVPESWYLF